MEEVFGWLLQGVCITRERKQMEKVKESTRGGGGGGWRNLENVLGDVVNMLMLG